MLPEVADVWGLCPECRQRRASRQWLAVSSQRSATIRLRMRLT